jgi:hypothetical protein
MHSMQRFLTACQEFWNVKNHVCTKTHQRKCGVAGIFLAVMTEYIAGTFVIPEKEKFEQLDWDDEEE